MISVASPGAGGRTPQPKRRPRRRTRGWRSLPLLSLVVVAMLLAACGSGGGGVGAAPGGGGTGNGGAGAGATKVNFNVYKGTPYTWLVVLAKSQGFFSRNGIDATLVPTDTGPAAIAGLVSGSLQFVSGDSINGGVPMSKGIPLKIVSGLMQGKQQVMLATTKANLPDTFPENVRALKGRPVGIVAPGSAANYYANMILEAGGLTDKDVQYASTTALPANVSAALESGRVDAAMTPLPVAYGMVASGKYKVLFNLDSITSELFPGKVPSPADLPSDAPLRQMLDKVHQYLWTTSSYAESNDKTVKQVQQALAQTDVWLHEPGNAEKAADWLIKNNEVTKIPGISEDQTRHFLTVTLPLLVSYAPPQDVEIYQKVWADAGVLTKQFPVKDFIYPGTPASPQEVKNRAGQATQG